MQKEIPFGQADLEDSFYHLFTVRRHLVRITVLCFSWTICGLVFFGLNLSRNGFFSDNLHANLLLPGLVDFLALVLATVTCHSRQRTLPVFMVFMFLSALCLFAMAPFQTCTDEGATSKGWKPCPEMAKWLVLLTQFSSLFMGGANWSILWLVTPSTFPTRMR